MIPTFAFVPHKGFGPAMLGSSRELAREAMAAAGFPLERTRKRSDSFCASSIQIECDDHGLVDFIGVAYSPRFIATYRDVEVFRVPAEQLFQLIAEADSSDTDTFNRSGYRFPGQVMTLWEADSQYDYLGNESKAVWAQVGIGSASYAAAIARMKGS